MGAYKSLTDRELADLLPTGNREAVREIYIRYSMPLANYSKKILGDDAIAEDVVADVFMKLLTQQTQVTITTSLQSYLFRATKNHALNHIARQQHRDKYAESLKNYYQSGIESTEQQVIVRELNQRLEDTLASLSPKSREIYELSRKEHLSRKEIAAAMGTSETAVNKQLHKIFKLLKARLTALLF